MSDVVIFEERAASNGQRIGFATLNAERSLNALSHDMVRLLDTRLSQWQHDPEIACVVLQGAGGKAFCSGGDVRAVRTAILATPDVQPNPEAVSFFEDEYRLDHRIHTYSKPILVWGSGIVMGGGLGLLSGASHRVLTETTRIAMPEIVIGLFPDVGASWFLNRMPGRTGLFVGLTAAPLNAHDGLFVGLGDRFLLDSQRDEVFTALTIADWAASTDTNRAMLSALLRGFALQAAPALPASKVREHYDVIQALCEGDSLPEVVHNITAYSGEDPWLKRAAETLREGSPTTAHLVWETQHRAKHMSLADVFRMEHIVSVRCCVAPRDFVEGVRARLVDKDNTPQWRPASLGEVTREQVEAHFSAPWSHAPLADLA